MYSLLLGGGEWSNASSETPSHGMLMGSALSGEIKIITGSGLSRNWAQSLGRLDCLNQPHREVVVLCFISKFVLQPL